MLRKRRGKTIQIPTMMVPKTPRAITGFRSTKHEPTATAMFSERLMATFEKGSGE